MTPAVALAETPLFERPLAELLEEAVAFHGHCCPGQVLEGKVLGKVGCLAIDSALVNM